MGHSTGLSVWSPHSPHLHLLPALPLTHLDPRSQFSPQPPALRPPFSPELSSHEDDEAEEEEQGLDSSFPDGHQQRLSPGS